MGVDILYIALYRKWRPKDFDDVFSQLHITETLKNEIKTNKISHAYLFCGTRGTGKTSVAKVFAKALNCKNPIGQNPCNKCQSCISIDDGSSIDVFEIDAASNRGIDDIRNLRESVRFAPAIGNYKVFIIDEVHMLTNEAFNALLKTLEEPPKYVVFILATTEPHKLLPTILSRCQRFDFKRISVDDIQKRLRQVCDAEGIQIEDQALRIIAKNSDGAMRDALSILDQCAVFSNEKITYDMVLGILGIVNNELLVDLSLSVLNEDCIGVIKKLDNIISIGKEVGQLIKDLIQHYRNLLMSKVVDNVEDIIDMSKEGIDELLSQAKLYTRENLIRCINILTELESSAKYSAQPKIMLEVALIKMCKLEKDKSLEGMLARLAKLESGVIIKSTSIKNEVKKVETQTVEKSKIINIKEKPISSDIKERWKSFMQDLKSKGKIRLRTYLSTGKPIKFEDNEVILSYAIEDSFSKDALMSQKVLSEIEELASEFFGYKLKIKAVSDNEFKDKKVTSKDIDIVAKAKELFGEDLVEVIDEE